MTNCHVPNCNKIAMESWAKVPVCYEHREAIEKEQHRFYAERITADERKTYLSIKPYTPWATA